MSSDIIAHWIDGVPTQGTYTGTAPVFNPATGAEIATVLMADAATRDRAITSAVAAGEQWGQVSVAKRLAVLFKFRELLEAKKSELAAIITREHGKVLSDALGEIKRGQEVVELACGFPAYLHGGFTENASTDIDVYSFRQPLGVVGIISPFNFPAMVPMWFFPVAIAAGNAVILKPSEKDPSAALWLAALWAEAGLPNGVFTVLQGDKAAVDALIDSPDVAALSFVGSTPIAQYIYSSAAAKGKRVQALGGAKNHMIVLPDADLDYVADQAVNAGYGAAGERCMAVSVVLAAESIANELVDKIKSRIATLRVGPGTDEPDLGPLITAQHRAKVSSYVDIAEADGAAIVVDGRGFQVDGYEDGFFFGPTLLDHVPTSSKAYSEEIFGPVLSVIRIATLDEGIELINSGAFGNGTAIFTRDGAAARQFQRQVHVGMIGVNVPIPVPVAYHSFGGWKQSLFGDAKAYGPHGFEFFTREKAVTSRWNVPTSSGALDLSFPQHG